MPAIWSIEQLERNLADGGVIVAHWRASLADGPFFASVYGSCLFRPDPSSPTFIPFDQLTEANVLQWVFNSLGSDGVSLQESRLQEQIEAERNPTVIIGKPW